MKKIMMAAAALLLSATAAHADALSDAKNAGQVGERNDGYLGIVQTNPSPSVTQLVESINAARKVEYSKIAAKNGQTLDVVEKLVAAKVIGGASKGQYVMDGSGNWVKK